ncbi:hypothetical protein V439_00520 [Clostridioides difficile]|nr:hypothetical protein V439_00520 [Clostridioides difficile]
MILLSLGGILFYFCLYIKYLNYLYKIKFDFLMFNYAKISNKKISNYIRVFILK